MNTDTHIDVFPGGGPKAGYGADRRSRDVRKGPALLGRIGQMLSRVSMALIATVAAGFLVAGSSAPAAALVISDSGSGINDTVTIDLVNDVGEMFDVSFDISLATGCQPGTCTDLVLSGDLTQTEADALANSTLSADIWFEISAVFLSGDGRADTIEFVITIEDTSSFDPFFAGINSRLTSYAIDTVSDPLTDAAITSNEGAPSFSATDWSADDGVNFPGGLGMVDACIFAGSCTAGMGGGLTPGEVDRMTLLLTGDFESDANLVLALSTFGIKWQTNAAEFLNNLIPCTNGGSCFQESLETFPGTITLTAIPLPASLPLFLSALAGLGLMGWRRPQAAG